MFDFLQEAGTPFTTAGVLFAIEHTPLYKRLEQEGRLLPYDPNTVLVHGSADLNFVPKKMTREELLRGYRWMIRALYRYDNYAERLMRALDSLGPPSEASRQSARRQTHRFLGTTARILAHFLMTRDRARRTFFIRILWKVLRRGLSLEKLVVAISYMAVHKHFHEYVDRAHGDTESAGCRSPFASVPRAPGVTSGKAVETVVPATTRTCESS
jgi:hypothetical protein